MSTNGSDEFVELCDELLDVRLVSLVSKYFIIIILHRHAYIYACLYWERGCIHLLMYHPSLFPKFNITQKMQTCTASTASAMTTCISKLA